ncbi:MAG: FAD-dependent oxidoreductase, partial [Mycobacterium sp.]
DLLVGADGIMSVVRELSWGDSPIREHNLHVIVGHSLDPNLGIERGYSLIHHDRDTQASWTSIRLRGVDGFQWWVVQRHSAKHQFDDDPVATAMAAARNFDPALTRLIETSDPSKVVRWQIRDRKPLDQLTRGRVVLTGDAAHPVSPYAAYGAGMAVEDGYFLGRSLAGVDLGDFDALRSALTTYEGPRREHTARQVQAAFILGQVFHRLPRPLAWVRDLVLDHTPLLQKYWAESIPGDIHRQLTAIETAEHSLKLMPGAG